MCKSNNYLLHLSNYQWKMFANLLQNIKPRYDISSFSQISVTLDIITDIKIEKIEFKFKITHKLDYWKTIPPSSYFRNI